MMNNRFVKTGVVLLVVALVMLLPLATAYAAQPGKSCEDTPSTPGHSVSAPGSAFNPDGQAGTVYAGTQPQNSNNTNSVSQYDVACYQQSLH